MRTSTKLFPLLLCTLLFAIVSNVSAVTGDGTLYVYTNVYTTEAPLDSTPPHTYLVSPFQVIWIQIAGITEFDPGDLVQVKVCFTVDEVHYSYTYSNVPVHVLGSGVGAGMNGVGDADHPIQWIVGDYNDPTPAGSVQIPVCTTMTVHYKNNAGTGPEYVANGLLSRTGHIHVIPQIPWGTIGSSLVLVTGLGAFVMIRRKKRS